MQIQCSWRRSSSNLFLGGPKTGESENILLLTTKLVHYNCCSHMPWRNDHVVLRGFVRWQRIDVLILLSNFLREGTMLASSVVTCIILSSWTFIAKGGMPLCSCEERVDDVRFNKMESGVPLWLWMFEWSETLCNATATICVSDDMNGRMCSDGLRKKKWGTREWTNSKIEVENCSVIINQRAREVRHYANHLCF